MNAPALLELQTRVLHAIRSGDALSAVDLVRASSAAQAARRVEVYANNAFENFCSSLRLSFPTVLRLVGEPYFAQCAARFRDSFPSRSGDLQHIGEPFARFLQTLHADDEFCYLADVARFEWQYQQSLIAADYALLDLQALGAVAQERYDDLCFVLHPSAQLFESPFPVSTIWRENGVDVQEPASIDLNQGGEQLLLVRASEVGVHVLTPGEFAFLSAMHAAKNFGIAIAGAITTEGAFDPVRALQRWVTRGAIVDFRLGHE